MLDGKRYYAESILRYSPTLIAALRALERELRPFIPTTKADN
jgi:hypothetical protein